MVTCADFWADLSAPFDPSIVSWRVGATTGDKSKGMALAYIDARDVMERLDTVCGPSGWECSYPHAAGKTVCEIRAWVPRGAPTDKIDDCEWEWITKSDGAGDTDHEAEKGALSDAFKRAAVRFGVGRYLYGLNTPWMPIEKFGNSYKLTDEAFKKLENFLRALQKHGGTNQERIALRLLCKSLDYMATADTITRFREEKKAEIQALSAGNQEAFNDYIEGKLKRMKEAQAA